MGSDSFNVAATEAGKTEADRSWTSVAICADDFGVDPQVDAAIVELAAIRRLNATSVLIDAGISEASVASLAELDIDVGLHLNFTDTLGDLTPHDVMSLKSLIVRAHARLLSRDWVRQTIERQVSRFEARFGRCPDYVDGHLHVHQLPVIREVLLEVLSARELPAGFWVRDTRAGALTGSTGSERFKAWVVGHLGMANLAGKAEHQHIAHNQGFFGVYDFTSAHRPFMQMMQDWLAGAKSGALVMTHPAAAQLNGDPIGQARVQEYVALGSPEFGALLQDSGVRLERLSQTLSSLP